MKKTYICSANIEFKSGRISSQGYISYCTRTKDCRECSLKNYHCLSKAKYRGLDNVQIQAYMSAIALTR